MSGDEVLLIYDGTCGFCHGAVRFVLRHDRKSVFRFAPLLGEVATDVMKRHGRDPAATDSMCVVLDRGTARERTP